uniref:DNA glycosylase/AP lyase ROS1-like n=1 Tax=Erigeron canadensis TaxID=72917 RepID=UPI001CB97AD9|nr:DNA glycosylase/AP lyase ROS1-like [Erigeron canadensis]
MEKDGTWIPLTPGKPIFATFGYSNESTLTSENGIIKGILNVAFPCIDLLDSNRLMEKGGMNETHKLPASILDEHEAFFGAVLTESEKTALGQDDTSCVQEEAVKVPSGCDGKKAADGLDESLGSVPTPFRTEDSRKRRNNGIDLNKKPSQRPRVKKHRPKIFDESKPKRVPKVQTPKGTTPRPKKTPKPATPNRVQEKSASSKHNKDTGSTDCVQNFASHGHVDAEQVVQEAARDSLVVAKRCNRYLDFDSDLVAQESHNVSKIQDSRRIFFNLESFGCLGKIVTSKRNTPRRSKFPKKTHQASEDLFGGNDKEKHEQAFCFTREEAAGKSSSKYVYFYQRRKKINSKVISYTPTVQVYRRTFRENNCVENSKKIGPNFPKLFKQRRTFGKKANIGWWCIDRVEDAQGNGKSSLRKCIQATSKKVHIKVDKSKDKKRLVKKPEIPRGEWLRSVFSPPRRKRSIRQIRRMGNNKDFLGSSRMPYDDDTYLKCQEEYSLQITDSLPQQDVDICLNCEENFLQITESLRLQADYIDINCEEENFLQITESVPVHEVLIHRIESFTSLHRDVQRIDDFVCGLNNFQLQEVPVFQSLVPRYEDAKDRRPLYEREMTLIVTEKMARLDINGQCNKLVVRDPNAAGRLASLDFNDQCKELVVRDEKVNGAIVKVSPTKKHKVLPKVDLDKETLRVWKLLMENDGSEQLEETDKDKNEWWDKQREIFRGRVDSFIAKMHLIQGDRRFSPWKGSVVDSVAGVYLTQNVSDHLSSSAFMSVAARFPVKPKSKKADDYFDEVGTRKESVTCNTKVTEDLCKNNGMEQDVITSCADAFSTTEPQQDVDSNPILGQDEPYANENSNTFRKRLEVEEFDFLKQFSSQESIASNNEGGENFLKNNDIEQNESTKCDEFGSQESFTSTTKDGEDLFKDNEMIQNVSPACADVTPTTKRQQDTTSDSILAQDKPCINANTNTSGMLPGVQEVDYPKEFCRSGINESSINESMVNWDLKTSIVEGEEQTVVSCDLQISSEPSTAISDVNVGSSETSERDFIGQLESICTEEPKVVTPVSSLKCVLNIAQGVNDVNNHQGMTEILVETGSTGKKKSKIEKKQESKIDWEALRKTYCRYGRRETDDNFMDAVDWDAVRRAPVEELAKVIAERGMNNVLAGRIKDFLDRVYQDHGAIDLEWLRDLPPDTAKEFLLSIDGIGLKSVECVRLLTLHHLAFPVDTNVGRVATRLGWVPLQPLGDVPIHLLNAYPMVDKIQKYLFPRLCTLDQRTLYELHYQLITFGKVFCTKVKPNCDACPMRAECRHYASAVASGRLKLPAPKEGSHVTSIVPVGNEQNYSVFGIPPSIIDLEVNETSSSYYGQTCEPIIEVPQSPMPEVEDTLISVDDIEDLFCESDDEIPTIRLNTEEFRETLKDTIDANKIPLSEGDMSKALVSLSAEAATFRMPQVKYVARLRTLHVVCELPDFHPCLAGFDEREHDDPSPYLLKIWLPGEIPNSLGSAENRVCDIASDNHEETVKATVLIPCRTANRGTFPLNGTYFQVNEVFADDETTNFPMDVPRSLVRNLPTRELGCGSSATSIFRALPTSVIQRLFWRGSICVRGFNRKTRKPHPLHRRFHISTAAIAAENKKLEKK